MASKLNEDCLLEIFRFLTPLEWVQISEVCCYWKRVVSDLWKKNKSILLTDNGDYEEFAGKYEYISAKNVRKALFYTAPFAEELTSEFGVKNFTEYCVRIGSFKYKIRDGNENDLKIIFKLLANRSTRLNTIHMEEVAEYIFPDIETFITLFKRNQIKRVLTDDYSLRTICENDLTNDIEELHWWIGEKENRPPVTPYKLLQHLPNLRKLTLSLSISWAELKPILLHDLPHLTKLMAFSIHTTENERLNLASEEFENILKLSQLEKLELKYFNSFHSEEIFFDKLASSLTKLRELYIDAVLNTGTILKLMAIPHLKTLKMRPEQGFCPTDIPENGNLSNYHVFFDDTNVPTTSTYTAIINALRKTPNLQSLCIRIKFSRELELPDIIFQLIIFLASKYQKLIISCLSWSRGFIYNLKLEQKSAFSGRQKEILHFSFQSWYSQTLLKRLKEHFREKISYC